MDSWCGVCGGREQVSPLEIPAFYLGFDRITCPRTQWKDTGDERQLTNSDAVDKILASAIEAVVNLENVITVFGHFVENRRVRIKSVIVVIGHLLSVGVVE